MITKLARLAILPAMLGLMACANDPVAQHEVACVGGALTGAVIGGAIGNQFGGGKGQAIMTGAGAFAGMAGAANAMDCVR